MNKRLAAILVTALAVCVCVAIAGDQYERKTMRQVPGSGVWTNNAYGDPIELKRIWIDDCGAAITTVSVTRVMVDDSNVTTTQTVGTVVTASGSGNTASFTAAYFKKLDKMAFASVNATSGAALTASNMNVTVDFVIQR